jgi:protein arginine N-methyltransferase 2
LLKERLLNSIYAELILQLLSSRGEEADALVLREVDHDHTALSSTGNFLSSRLKYVTDAHGQEICLLQDGDTEIGVMMGWERGISTFCSCRHGCMLKDGSNLSA